MTTNAPGIRDALTAIGLDLGSVELMVVADPPAMHHSPRSSCERGRELSGMAAIRVDLLDEEVLCPRCYWGSPELRLTYDMFNDGGDPDQSRATDRTNLDEVVRVSDHISTLVSGTPRDLDELFEALENAQWKSSSRALRSMLHPGLDVVGELHRRLGSELFSWLHHQLVGLEVRELVELQQRLARTRARTLDVDLDEVAGRLRTELMTESWCLLEVASLKWMNTGPRSGQARDSVHDLIRSLVFGQGTRRAPASIALLTDAMVRALEVRGVVRPAEVAVLPHNDVELVNAVRVLHDPENGGACTTLAAALEVATALDA